ncbi:unnamed protein product [Moneuplotes crassus]|uniref:Ethanolaminephosphotransferase n=1 Tax=Euplotes crassus TaxID=5936 RepID=A0AAD1UQ10_EUPCR|nr:unnamed protein product [Moneuplotes crassus]
MSYLLGNFISEKGEENIKNHKYVPGEYSPMDNLLNPFWIWIVEFLPKWMAPNLVTFVGLAALGGAYLLMLVFDLSMTQPVPEFTYLLVAIGIFVFQTLDAIDGKQARRTGSSSPLGQLFDHGCDSISWTICSMNVISFLGLGLSFNGILAMYSTMVPFYFLNLIEYNTGVFYYSVGIMDGTSAQFMLMFFNILSFTCGADIYQRKISDLLPFMPNFLSDGYLLKHYVMVILIYVGVGFSITMIIKLLNSAKGVQTKMFAFLQIIQHLGIYGLMYLYDADILFVRDHAGIAYISVICMFVLLTCKLIVCLMSKMEYNVIHFEFLIFAPYFYIQSQYDATPESESALKIAFYATFVVMLLITFRFIQTSIGQLTKYLEIHCFKIGPRKEKKQ